MAKTKWTQSLWLLLIPAIGFLTLLPVLADGPENPLGPTFRADYVFKGSSLNGWKTLGKATWKARDGMITGTATDPSGGWLLLDRSYQNIALYSGLHCTSGCKAGVLMRAVKTPDGGMKGVFASLTEGDMGVYAIAVDAQGKEISREKLPPPTPERNMNGGAPNPNMPANQPPGGVAAAVAGRGGRGAYGALPPPEGVQIPESLVRNAAVAKPGSWNEFEERVADDNFDVRVNGGTLGGGNPLSGAVSDDIAGYGPIALYVGGTGDAQFSDLRYKDLSIVEEPKEEVSKNFRMHRLDGLYFSWTAQIADVNHDGIPDIIAGPFYYLGPNYTEAHEIYKPAPFNPGSDYAQTSMVSLAYDFTGDGWPDILVMSGNAGNGTGTLYVNPKGESRYWDHYVVLPRVGNEETILKDIDGDGKPEVIHAMDNALCYSKPDPANPTGPWITTTITEKGPWGVNIGHGIGVGDINGDGRMDLVNAYGWWEHPAKGSSQKLWTYHAQAFGRLGHSQGGAGGAEIGVYDVNGDGLMDVVTVMEGHGFGLAWYEQKRDAQGKISWIEHPIMNNFLTKNAGDVTFTEPHSIAFADVDGDGILDFVTGKRAFSHLYTYSDPDPLGPAVLYWYRAVRDPKAPGGARFEPELIHNRSGVGSHIAVADLNGDGKPDVVTSGAYGTFIFYNEMKKPVSTATKPAGN
jgi:Domain of Unknown Function (DUF1080)/FG-GAP-like repeat/FG-GAP repeat